MIPRGFFLQKEDYLFTSESVSEGHPDKVCDQISDAILDYYLEQDPYSRIAIETLATKNAVIIAGEVRTETNITPEDIKKITRSTIKEIGYEQEDFHWKTLNIECYLQAQSLEIAKGVDEAIGKEEGAGDQGIMFGYAVNETDVFQPATLHYAHLILRRLSEARKSGQFKQLGLDGKSQLTLIYRNRKPIGVHSIVVSHQHSNDISQEALKQEIYSHTKNILPKNWLTEETAFYVNPTGAFTSGGPACDCGLTGRKIIVDTYGGAAPHGGGAFSGKDPTKVDRSAAYMCRYMAKNIVAANLADECTIQLSYAIGLSSPLSLYINLHQTQRCDLKKLQKRLTDSIDLTPKGIRTYLQLNKPIYNKTATYGHFGRMPTPEGHFTWEKTDLAEHLKDLLD